MSKELRASEIETFDSMVKHAYQQGAKLRDHVTTRTGVHGASRRFTVMSKGLANQKWSQAPVTPMNVTYQHPVATIEDWVAPEYTDKFDDYRNNFSEIAELGETIGNALGRRSDQIILNAVAGATVSTLAADIGGTSTALSYTALTEAVSQLGDEGLSTNEKVCFVFPWPWFNAFMQQEKLTSMFYMDKKPLASGKFSSVLGWTIVFVENRADFEGYNSAGGVGWVWHKQAVGLVEGLPRKTEVNYIADRTSWLSNGLMAAGACVIDPKGVIRIRSTATGL